MDKDQEMEMITDAPEDGPRVDGAQSDQDDQVMAILEHWRSAWTDLSRIEAVVLLWQLVVFVLRTSQNRHQAADNQLHIRRLLSLQ